MSTKHLLDPQLAKAIEMMTSFTMSAETVAMVRAVAIARLPFQSGAK